MKDKNKAKIHWFENGTFAIKIPNAVVEYEKKIRSTFPMLRYKVDSVSLGRFSILQAKKEEEFHRQLLEELKEKIEQFNKLKGKNDVNKK